MIFWMVLIAIGIMADDTIADEIKYKGARCIANICPGEASISLGKAVKGLNKAKLTEAGSTKYRCLNLDKKTFLWAMQDNHLGNEAIGGIFISDRANCVSSSIGKMVDINLETEKGIKIGSAENDVTNAYGTPDKVYTAVNSDSWYLGRKGPASKSVASNYFGERVLLYSSESSLAGSRFFIKNGKVSAILITYSE